MHPKQTLGITAFFINSRRTHVSSRRCIHVARKCGHPPTQAFQIHCKRRREKKAQKSKDVRCNRKDAEPFHVFIFNNSLPLLNAAVVQLHFSLTFGLCVFFSLFLTGNGLTYTSVSHVYLANGPLKFVKQKIRGPVIFF